MVQNFKIYSKELLVNKINWIINSDEFSRRRNFFETHGVNNNNNNNNKIVSIAPRCL